MASIFNEKIFNGEVFGQYVDRVPNLKQNQLIKSKAIVNRNDLKAMMSNQVGGNFISIPLKGLISGQEAQNYDGATDMQPESTTTYMHSRVVVGRMKSWKEDDFSADITGGVDFMEDIASQVAEYWQEVDQRTLLAVLEGIFNMTGAANLKFVNNHTVDVTGVINTTDTSLNGMITATTVNSAMQKAMGDNKGKLSLIIMHSVVATNLENLKLLTYMKFNDANGLEREIGLATLHGRLVLIDDGMPVEEVAATYALTTDTEINAAKTYYTKSGTVYTPVASPVVGNIATYYEMKEDAYSKYTTYILGDGAIEYTDAGAKVPYSMDRNEEKNGGQEMLYSRQRKCFAPYGISFTNSTIISPTEAELKDGANWSLVKSQGATVQYIDHKAIPIARIVSRG